MVSPAPASIRQRIFGGFEEEHSLAHELPAVVTDAIHLPREPFSWVVTASGKEFLANEFSGLYEPVADKPVGSGPPALLGVKKHSLPSHCPGLFAKLSPKGPEPDWEVFRFFLSLAGAHSNVGQSVGSGMGKVSSSKEGDAFLWVSYPSNPSIPPSPSNARLPYPELSHVGVVNQLPQMTPERSQSFVREMADHGRAACVLTKRK